MASDKLPLDPYGATAGRKHIDGKNPRPKTVTVDFHNHMEILVASDFIKPHLPAQENMNLRVSNPRSGEITKKQFEVRRREWREIDKRLEDMDAMDLDVMAVSCLPMQFYYATDANAGHEASQIINDGIASNIKSRPDRFVGLGTVLGTASLPVYFLMQQPRPLPLVAFGVAMAAFVAYTHRSNIERMRAGTENRARRLWLLRPR